MKRILSLTVFGVVTLLALTSGAAAQVPNIMYYQGHLTDEEGAPLDTVISMTFTIYDDPVGSSAWWTETQDSVMVANGLFHVLLGSVNGITDTVFLNAGRWLGITIGSDPEISPRTELVTVPWAFRVATVDGAGGGIISSRVDVLGIVDADGFTINDIPVGTSSDSYWSQNGSDIFYNLGSVGIGTTTPSEALDVEGNIHSGGTITSGSSITIDGTTNQITSTSGAIDFDNEDIVTTGKLATGTATIGPGHTNTGSDAFVAGRENIASGDRSTVSGGFYNEARGGESTVGGGKNNLSKELGSTISGGWDNLADSGYTTVAGGIGNSSIGAYSAVGGGFHNTASGHRATVAGGSVNLASGSVATVSGGSMDTASGIWSTIGGGKTNKAIEQGATVAGGIQNHARARESTIGGGWGNATDGQWSVVSGGYYNLAAGDYSFIGSGWHNLAEGEYSAILGGYGDTIGVSADYSYLFGIGSRLNDDSTFMVDMPHILLQGEIFQADPDGDTICELSGFSTGGGFIGTYGSNGNLNAGLTVLSGYPNNGAFGALNANGAWRAAMYADPTDDVGYIDNYGPNGNVNVRLWNALVDDNGGCVSIADAAGEYRGHFLVTDDSAAMLELLGPNGYFNVYMGIPGPPNDDPNNGMIGVCDNDGILQAGMYVDTSGQGIVWGDQKSFRIPNPNQLGTDIWYCCLEGPEAAAYVRGTGHLVNGRANVSLPDHFTAVASSQGITVQVTPLSGESKGLAVVEKSTDRFAVRELNNGGGTYDFDFMVTAVRKGHEDYKVIRASIETQPVERGATKDESTVRLMQRSGK